MSRHTTFAEGEYYHIFHRGVDKRTVFGSKEEHERFMLGLFMANSGIPLHPSDAHREYHQIFSQQREEQLVHIGAYALMPNHFHLLVHEHSEGGLSKFMQKLLTGYTMYYNKKHERSGPLFGGRFKSVAVTSDEQLKYLYAYIHLNPLSLSFPKWKEGKSKVPPKEWEKSLSRYQYSSYLDYSGAGERPEKNILTPIAFPEYFENGTEMMRDLREWVEFDKPTTAE